MSLEVKIVFDAKETIWALAQLSDQRYLEFAGNIHAAYKILSRIASKPLHELAVPEFDIKKMIPEEFQTDELMYWVFDAWEGWFKSLAEEDLNIKTVEFFAARELRNKVTGNYSCDYSDLVPKWLPEIPIDPFTGKPLEINLHADDGEDKNSNPKTE